MTWQRDPVAKALAAAITTVVEAVPAIVTVFDHPPFTLNADAIVIGRPTEVRYSMAGLSIDEVILPVVCVGGADQDDTVSELIGYVRSACADPTLGHVVQLAVVTGERAWRNEHVAGADLLVAEATLTIQM